jgi:catechol 2,3-dioxygenase-like lactoylglutathione lyase family enzyme
MITGIDTVFVWVRDIDKSVEWYQRFGIAAGSRHGVWQSMSLPGPIVFALHQGLRPPGDSMTVIAFAVTGLESEIDRLSLLGINQVGSTTDTGAKRFATFSDPDGNELQLSQLS